MVDVLSKYLLVPIIYLCILCLWKGYIWRAKLWCVGIGLFNIGNFFHYSFFIRGLPQRVFLLNLNGHYKGLSIFFSLNRGLLIKSSFKGTL